MIYLKSFGERLTEAREQQKISQKRLAEMLDITPTRLNYWEKGKREPNIDMIKRLASALNISVSDLLVWDEFDRQHPDAIKAIKEYLEFVNFLEKAGYSYQQEPVKWHWEDEEESDPSKRVQIADEWEITLSKEGHEAKFTQSEFEELQTVAKEAIEGKFYKKVTEQQK